MAITHSTTKVQPTQYGTAAPSPADWNAAHVGDVTGLTGAIPAGGTTGQALEKNSNADYDVGWVTPTASVVAGQSNVLAADVAMALANTYYDGPTLALAAVGTYLLVGAVMCRNAAGATLFTVKLWDGATVFASANLLAAAGSGGAGYGVFPVAAVITTAAPNTVVKISAAATGATSTIRAAAVDNAAGNTASYLTATRLA